MSEAPTGWDAGRVRALREQLGLSQRELADELGVRQQTVSEWETGAYRPRGASLRVLRLVAERADSPYTVDEHPAGQAPTSSGMPNRRSRGRQSKRRGRSTVRDKGG